MTTPVYALKETLQTERLGKDIWYRFWTVIGPCTTEVEAERALFKNRDEVLQSNALRHSLTFWKVIELPADAPGNINWNQPAQKPDRRRRRA